MAVILLVVTHIRNKKTNKFIGQNRQTQRLALRGLAAPLVRTDSTGGKPEDQQKKKETGE